MMKIRERLLKKFHSFTYRHTYVDEFTDAYIATQVKVLREQRGLNQTELGELAGMRQSQISELEDVNNRSWKVLYAKEAGEGLRSCLGREIRAIWPSAARHRKTGPTASTEGRI